MPANLMETDSMAYVGETPWHRLGTKLPEGADALAFMVAAGLDWIVERRPMSYQPVSGGDSIMTDHYALVRSTDGRFFGSASKYKPFQNSEIFQFMGDVCRANHMTMETAGSLKDGEIVWSLARTDESATLPKGGDRLSRYVLLTNSHKPGSSFRYAETTVRVVCWNTLMFAFQQADQARTSWRFRHTQKFGAYAQVILDDLKLESKAFGESVEVAREAQKLKLTRGETEQYIGDVCGWRVVEEMIEQAHAEAAYQSTIQEGGSVLDAIVQADEAGKDIQVDRLAALTASPIAVRQIKTLSRNAEAALRYVYDSPGADLEGSKGTLWGALNGVTYWADHDVAGGSLAKRVASVTVGTRQKIKERAYQTAREMVSR
jgi:phage/plasmid-like protein (TIGR03299 family)